MANSVYTINKGVDKSIEFKGLKAQYIWWMGGGLVGVLMIFAIFYLVGVNTYVALVIAVCAAAAVIVGVFRLSNTYGEHGMMKMLARRQVPRSITAKTRSIFWGGADKELNNSLRES